MVPASAEHGVPRADDEAIFADIEGDGVGVMRAFTGHGEATHSQLDPDEADAAAIAAAALWLLVA